METGILKAQLHPSGLKTSVLRGGLIPERRASPNKSETWRNSENPTHMQCKFFVCLSQDFTLTEKNKTLMTFFIAYSLFHIKQCT